MHVCYIGIGSNLGDREENIRMAIDEVRKLEGTKVTKVSSIIETLPVGGPVQGKFLNAAMEIKTGLSPGSLLSALQEIENRLGRKRLEKDGPRTIDLDILLYAGRKINEEGLIVPHPRMKERDFVLMPLKEIASAVVEGLLHEDNKKDPGLAKRIKEGQKTK